MEPHLLNKDQVADRLGISPAYVLELARRKKLHSIRVGKFVRFDPDRLMEDLQALLIAPLNQAPAQSPLPLKPLPMPRRRRFS